MAAFVTTFHSTECLLLQQRWLHLQTELSSEGSPSCHANIMVLTSLCALLCLLLPRTHFLCPCLSCRQLS